MKKNYTIMHLIATNFYGGPEKQILEHLKRLSKNCYRGMVASFIEGNNPNEILDYAKNLGLEHVGITLSQSLDLGAFWKLYHLLRKGEIDLLCTHGYKSTILGWLACRRVKVPVLVFSRGYTGENRKVAFFEWLERRILGRVDGLVCVSEGQLRKLESFGIQNRRSWIVHNAITSKRKDTEQTNALRKEVAKRLAIPDEGTMIVSAGRLSPEKGHRFLLDAVKILERKADNTCFIFCGEGACRESLENQAKRLGIEEKCRFVGFRRDLDEIFSVMDFMVLPSLTEGLPNVILEAFACARPVVAASVGGVPEVVDNGIDGFLVPPGRPDLLAEAIGKFLSHPELRQPMGRAGYFKVKTRFTFESQNQKLEAVYHEILLGPG
ncbi:MAG: glycosyltransferase [bacterium]